MKESTKYSILAGLVAMIIIGIMVYTVVAVIAEDKQSRQQLNKCYESHGTPVHDLCFKDPELIKLQ